MRRALTALAFAALLASWLEPGSIVPSAAAFQAKPSRPNPQTFQGGDLVWPRLPGAIVPYDSAPGEATNAHAERWTSQQKQYLTRPAIRAIDTERNTLIQALTYERFVEVYLGGAPLSNPGQPASNQPYVGHVGIIEMTGAMPWVVEAVPGGVRRVTYDQWLNERPRDVVWHGRFKSADAPMRAQIVVEAARQIKKPYDFWNLNLRDESGFYCSKLAWLSIVKATRVAPDDNLEGERRFWYSPKELMHSPRVTMLYSPEPYGAKG